MDPVSTGLQADKCGAKHNSLAPIYGAAIAYIKEEGRGCVAVAGTSPCSTLTISSNRTIERSNAE
jgi:hypothetical protein